MRLITMLLFTLFTITLSAQEPVLRMDKGLFKTSYYSGSDFLTKQQFEALIHKDPLSSSLWSQSKELEIGSIVFLVGSLGFLTAGLTSKETSSQLVWYTGALGLDIAALVLNIKAGKKARQAVDGYNGIDLSLSTTSNGVGLVWVF